MAIEIDSQIEETNFKKEAQIYGINFRPIPLASFGYLYINPKISLSDLNYKSLAYLNFNLYATPILIH